MAAPTIDAVTTGDSGLTVSWTAPTSVTGIVAYDVRYILTSADETDDANWIVLEDAWTPYQSPTLDPLVSAVTGLTNGDGYDIQVRAVAGGDGTWSATSTGTPADHGGTNANAVVLRPSQPRVGSLPVGSSDVDVFSFSLRANQGYVVYATGALDTSAVVKRGNDDVLLDDNSKDGRNFFLSAREGRAGTYYVHVSRSTDDSNPATSAPYVIHLKQVAAAPRASDAVTLDLDSTSYAIPGIGFGASNQYFKIALSEETDLAFFPSILNVTSRFVWAEAELLTESGELIEHSDFSLLPPSYYTFHIRRTLPAGTYYLKVNPLLGGAIPVHARVAVEPGDDRASAGVLWTQHLADDEVGERLGRVELGAIKPATDSDYFRLELTQSDAVLIRGVSSHLQIQGELLDGNGAPVEANHYNPDNAADRDLYGFMIQAFLNAGEYYVKVTGVDPLATGPYTIKAITDPYERTIRSECSALPPIATGTDPLSGCAWHLANSRQFGGAGEDINVEEVWTAGFRGEGITVAVVDDGLDYLHPDLKDNVAPRGNYDYVTQDSHVFNYSGVHGTNVAGVLAARDNLIGSRGVAPRATLFGFSLLKAPSAGNQVDAVLRGHEAMAVSNNSWGLGPSMIPSMTFRALTAALEGGVTDGYGGLGTFYVFAVGNLAEEGGIASLQETHSWPYVTVVCGVNLED